MVAPQIWHTAATSPYARPCADCDFDALQWQVKENAGRFGICDVKGRPLVFTTTATLLSQPARWNDDPRQSLTVRLAGDELTKGLQALEDWALSKIPSRDEAKTVVKTNVFQESFVRAQLANATRFYSKDGVQSCVCADNGPVTCLMSVVLYKMNGLKGLSLRLLAMQG